MKTDTHDFSTGERRKPPHLALADLINAVGDHYARTQAPKAPPLDQELLAESQRAMSNIAGIAKLVTGMGVPEAVVRAEVHRYQVEQARVEQRLIAALLALPHSSDSGREA